MKRIKQILLIVLCFLLPILIAIGCCIWYFVFPQLIYGVCRTPVINSLFDDETLIAAYRSAPLASRDRFAMNCHRYGAADEPAIRLMLLGYKEGEKIPEVLLLYALDPKFRTTAPLALKLIAENMASNRSSAAVEWLSSAAVDRLFEMAEAGGHLHDDTYIMPVALLELSWRDKERSKRAVETINGMFRDEVEARRRKRAAEDPEEADSPDSGGDAISKPIEPFVGFSEEPGPKDSYIYFVKTGDYYPPEFNSGEKK